MKNDFYMCTATQLKNYIKENGAIVAEISKSFIKRYDEVECIIKAWADYDKNIFLQQAHEIDKKILSNKFYSEDLLVGIPIGIKDTYNTEFFMTQRGSEIYKNYKAGNDARVVRKARDCGALIAGKTKTAEFSIHHPSDTVNPHNIEHTPGTSSGGSAASVASGMVPVAFGTQTAGSTSKPASYCGIYGFKPTFGLFPRTGVLKTCDTLDTLSVLTRSVNDIDLLFNSIRLRGSNHPFINLMLDKNKKDLKKPRVALLTSPEFDLIDNDITNKFFNLSHELERALGVSVEIRKTPSFLDEIAQDHEKIYSKSVSYYFKNEYRDNADQISNITQSMIQKGMDISSNEYIELVQNQAIKTDIFDKWMNDNYDFVFTLATSSESPKGLIYHDKPDSSLIWTYLGVPMMICPKFKALNGLPFGFQVMTRKYFDNELINFTKLLKERGVITDSLVKDI